MQVNIDGHTATVIREGERIKNESHLFYLINKTLKSQGFDTIKKPMWKDGHLTDSTNFYVRSRKRTGSSVYCIYDDQYQVRDASKDLRRDGSLELRYEIL